MMIMMMMITITATSATPPPVSNRVSSCEHYHDDVQYDEVRMSEGQRQCLSEYCTRVYYELPIPINVQIGWRGWRVYS